MNADKFILITGVSSGIGFALADHYCNQGFKVIGTVRKIEDAETLSKNPCFFPIVYDVKDKEGLVVFRETVNSLLSGKKLFALINNAGIVKAGPLECISEEDFSEMMDVNVYAVRRITNEALAFMEEGSRIVNMSSVSGLFNSPFSGTYCISKHALESMTDVYRRELMGFGIKVIAIEPGPIKTPIWSKSKGSLDKYFDTRYGDILRTADKIIDNAEKSGLDVSYVVTACDKALLNPNPKTRYLIHRKPFIFKMLYWLIPDKIADKLVAKTLSGGESHRIV